MRQLLFALLLAVSPTAAATIYSFSWDTSLLQGTNSNYVLDIQLIGTAGNQVSLSTFNYGVGGSGPTATVNFDSSTNFFTDSLLTFTPGPQLTFTLTTTNVAGPFPDNLSIYLLDTGLNPIPTTDTSTSALLSLDLEPFALNRYAGSSDLPFPAPTLTLLPSSGGTQTPQVPEPASLGLLSGILALWCLLRKQ